jgi:hypothetical protein
MISPAWLKAGEIFPETTVFMIAIQDQFIRTNNYKKYFCGVVTERGLLSPHSLCF